MVLRAPYSREPGSSTPSRPSEVRAAFTLTELLAATSAVALLVALVQPSLESARNLSKLSVCTDRLAEIGEATALYTALDPHGHAIPVHRAQILQAYDDPIFVGPYEWGGKSGIGFPNFLSHYATFLGSKYGTAAGFGPAARPLNRILYPHPFRDNGHDWGWVYGPPDIQFNRTGARLDTRLQLEKVRCPADDGPPRGAHCRDWLANPHHSSFDHFGTSYAANTFMIASSGSDQMRSNSPYLRPATRVPNPARTYVYEENIGRWAWACKRERDECLWIGQGVDPGPTKSLRGWHGKSWTYNHAFADGHVEFQPVYIDGTEDEEGYANHYVNELLPTYPDFPDCSKCDLLDPDCSAQPCGDTPGHCFERYRCILVRGPGWQKDTMPAPFVCTGVRHSGYGRPSYARCVYSDQ